MTKLYVEATDVNQAFIRTSNFLQPGALGPAYIAALQAISNAGIQEHTFGAVVFDNNASTDAQYPSATDTAVMLYQTTIAGRIRVTVPAPVSTIFLADQLTVDAVAIAPFTAAVLAALGDNLGNAATAFVQGVRSTRRRDQQ